MPNKQPALILLDLDGFCRLRANGEISYPFGTQTITVPLSEPEASFGAYQGDHLGAIVCIAFNQETAHNPRFHFSFLARLAHNIARQFDVQGDVICEVALCFTAPESADIALLRLLEHAPHPHHIGPFSRVFLLSEDLGLRRSFNARLSFENHSLHSKKVNWLGWQTKRAYTRFPPPTAEITTSFPPPQGHSVPIQHPSHLVWASKQPVEIGESAPIPSEELWQHLLVAIEQTPHLISQISTTKHSTRGVLRNTPALCSPSQIGECSENDGLFLQHLPLSEHPQPSDERSTPSTLVNDSLCPGAVHLTAQRMTLRTRLPSAAIIRYLASFPTIPVQSSSFQIKDVETVQALPSGATFGHVVSVSVPSPQAQPMRWKIDRSTNNAQQAWWWSEGKATSCCNFYWDRVARRPSFQVKAQMRREGNALVMAIPLGCRKAEPIESIAPWTIGIAQAAQGLIAILAQDSPLQKGQSYEIIPIQDQIRPIGISLHIQEAQNRWADLQKCPIGVIFVRRDSQKTFQNK